jgi:hypothetical protein
LSSVTLGGPPIPGGPYAGYSWVAENVPMRRVTEAIDGSPELSEVPEFDVFGLVNDTQMRVTFAGELKGSGFPVYHEKHPTGITGRHYVVVANADTPYKKTYVFKGPVDNSEDWGRQALAYLIEECVVTRIAYLPIASLGAALDADFLASALLPSRTVRGPRLITTTHVGDSKTEIYHVDGRALDTHELPEDAEYGYYVLLAIYVSKTDEAVAASGQPDNRPNVHLAAIFLDTSIGVYRPVPVDRTGFSVTLPAIASLQFPHELPAMDLQTVIATLAAPTSD